ncbi:MAG: hypothetical protein QXR96_01820 [Candidatus Woesearchaeota archaeon]
MVIYFLGTFIPGLMPNDCYLKEKLDGDLGEFLRFLTEHNLLLVGLNIEYSNKLFVNEQNFQKVIRNASFYIPQFSEISSLLNTQERSLYIENKPCSLSEIIQTAKTKGYNLIILNPLPIILSPKRCIIKLDGLYSQFTLGSLRYLVNYMQNFVIDREYHPHFFEKK